MDERNPERDLRLVDEERDDYPNETLNRNEDANFGEETAAEVSPNATGIGAEPRQQSSDGGEAEEDAGTEGRGLGAIGVAIAIVSLFFLPVILGATAIVIGFIARARGHAGLGYTAIGIGAFSIIISLFMSPFF
ncbi:DUF4190 domain-containing protein [Alteribacter populi]|uniref:DUF4190 domain-containing protein n=1 Tax=Alteribacter populi TaxID=2011011 RepID=UPI001E2A4342|nr:DUF4190 domain-containing protein [Alteribacter populi]